MKATPTRDDKQAREREAEKAKERGDVIGLGDADPHKKLPGTIRQDGSHPAGIEVRSPATGIGDLSQGSGATGIDMGAGGKGTQISDETTRRDRRDKDDNAS